MKTGCNADERVRAAVVSGLDLPPGVEPHLAGALKHTLACPGNLVRARLVYQVARVCRMPERPALDVAVAIEFFHTASLLFDDLPLMDDARERRGAVCVHRVYGESAAVLAALALINRAYGRLWQALAGASPEARARSARMVEGCLGLNGVLDGQSRDLHCGGSRPTGRQVMRVAMGKTVSLIRLSLLLPAVLGEAPEAQLSLLRRLAVFWGLSYQMLDDLKDVLLAPAASGKTAGRDEPLNRPNLALAEGADPALRRVRRLLRLGDATLERLAGARADWRFLEDWRGRLAEELQRCARAAASAAA